MEVFLMKRGFKAQKFFGPPQVGAKKSSDESELNFFSLFM